MNLDNLEQALQTIYNECVNTHCKDCCFKYSCDAVFKDNNMCNLCIRLLEEVEFTRGFKRLQP